jgi:phospholipase/carboxylesterase
MRGATWAGAAALTLLLSATPARGEDVALPDAVRQALRAYLEAPEAKDRGPLDRLLAACKGDLAVALRAIRARAPLEDANPGVFHGKTFRSDGKAWEYSIRLPKGYDGKKRFPVLVLPDHGSVDAESGIAFWDGKAGAEEYVLFRPVIVKFQEDKQRFPDQQFFARDVAIARVMADALATLRLRYAVDPDRLVMTGLSQAGYYTWYYAVTSPDQFAGIVPESAGGVGVRAAVLPLARNLASTKVRILHTKGDQICPFSDAEAMREAIARAGGKPELIAYEDSDYPGAPFPKRHPGPHHLRLRNVLPWGLEARRTIPASFARVLRYPTQGFEGRFRIPPPKDPKDPVTVTCGTKEDGTPTCDRKGAVYLVDPDVLVQTITKKPSNGATHSYLAPVKPDLRLLFTTFKATGDDGRLVAGEITLD